MIVDHCWDVDPNPEVNCANLTEVDNALTSIFVDVTTLTQIFDMDSWQNQTGIYGLGRMWLGTSVSNTLFYKLNTIVTHRSADWLKGTFLWKNSFTTYNINERLFKSF